MMEAGPEFIKIENPSLIRENRLVANLPQLCDQVSDVA